MAEILCAEKPQAGQRRGEVSRLLFRLRDYVETENFRGYDPYDGLTSRVFARSPLNDSLLARLCWIQLFRRNPLNVRKIFGVPKAFNAKAGALFLSGYLNAENVLGRERVAEPCSRLLGNIQSSALPREKGVAWGYPFPWQAKAFYVEPGTPNLVASVYVGQALLDYHAMFGNARARELARAVRDFILHEMIIWETDDELCFSYIPGEKAEVHNANLMAAAFLARVNRDEPDDKIGTMIRKAVAFSIRDVSGEGFWPYGTMPHHRWMDNFHTAFNLEALLTIRQCLALYGQDELMRTVYRFYRRSMFTAEGIPKYYHNKQWPVDSHTLAESVIVLSRIIRDGGDVFSQEERSDAGNLIGQIIDYVERIFFDNRRGCFYYQKHKLWFNRIPYMRWSQAWMFYALSCVRALNTEDTYASSVTN